MAGGNAHAQGLFTNVILNNEETHGHDIQKLYMAGGNAQVQGMDMIFRGYIWQVAMNKSKACLPM